MKVDISFKGDLVLEATLERAEKEVRNQVWEVLTKTAESGKLRAKYYAPVDTGFLKANIVTDLSGWSELNTKIHSQAPYSGFVEYGTRFMAAQPFMRPALKDVESQFRKDIENAAKRLFK